jgi:hypothetical protein
MVEVIHNGMVSADVLAFYWQNKPNHSCGLKMILDIVVKILRESKD